MNPRPRIILLAVSAILVLFGNQSTSEAQTAPSSWRVNGVSFADFANRMSKSIEGTIPGMPFYGANQTPGAAFVPLDFRYAADNVPASPITTQPMSKVGFWASWTVDLNDDNIWLYAIPGSALETEFTRRNEIRRCSNQTIDNGQPAFGPASCNSSGGSGSRGDSSLGGARYVGYATVAVLRSCGVVIVNTQLSTHSPRSAGLDPQPDAISESRSLASKYAKDIMQKLLVAFDQVCTFGPTYPTYTPTPTPTPAPTYSPTPAPTPSPSPLATPAQVGMLKLVTYYNHRHNDSVTLSSDDAIRGAGAGGYTFSGDAGGYVFSGQALGTVPLKLYYNSSIGDYFTTATAEGERSAVAAGYRFVRVEGYVFSSYQPLTVPLKLFWSANRSDNLTIATPEGETGALNSGYSFVRVEGHIPKSLPSAPVACGLGVRWDEYEDGWTGLWQRRGNSDIFDSIWTGPAGQRASAVMSIGMVGDQVTVQRTQPNGGTCTYAGTLGVDGLSVTGSYYCSWWPNGGRTQWRASIRCS